MIKCIFLALFFLHFCYSSLYAASIKEPNVAGAFYTANSQELSSQIDSFIDQATIEPSKETIQAMIVPHAGYVYSGSVAAYGYKAISKQTYKTIVILAPSHFYPFDGISVWKEGAFKTPLGTVNVDEDFAGKLMEAGRGVLPYAPTDVFEKEHALEVQLPFIQKVFGSVKIVPILMGNPDPKVCQKLAAALNKIVGSREDVLVIASSDMSHYLPYDQANSMDRLTLKAIGDQDPEQLWNGCVNRKMEMCGFVPVTTLLLYAKERGLKVQMLKYANSGDTAGDKSKVVGYSSIVFYQENRRGVLPYARTLNTEQKTQLLSMARWVLKNFVESGKVPEIKMDVSQISDKQGAFVTLHKNGQLRGCIGHITSDQPLYATVRDMTIAAASEDPRFSPVTKEELSSIDIEISVLTVPRRVADASSVVLGRDGVIVSDGGSHQGVFLPQVATETNWSKEEFLSELCSQKAGLPADCWKNPKTILNTFQAEVFN